MNDQKKKQKKGPAYYLPANAVFKARAAALTLTGERDRAVQALRHSNAVAVYLLGLVDGHVKIPISEYKKLLEDDTTTVKIAYEEHDAVITLAVETPFETGVKDTKNILDHAAGKEKP